MSIRFRGFVNNFILAALLIFLSAGCSTFKSVPSPFIGTWKTDCADQDNILGVQITENQMLFWETIGDIKKIKSLGNGVYEINLDLFSEGQEWNASMQYKVNGSTLIQLPSDGIEEITRFRCKNV